MIMRKKVVILFVFISSIAYSQKQTDICSELYLDSIFQENPGTFVLYDLQNNNYQVYNPDRAKKKYAVLIEVNTCRVKENPDYYRQRQQITEYPFGTPKRQREFAHTNARGRDNVPGEVDLVFTGYNLTR